MADGNGKHDSQHVPQAMTVRPQGRPQIRGRRPAVESLIQHDGKSYQKMLLMIESGGTDYICAEAIGVTERTFARWKSIGRQEWNGWMDLADELADDENLTTESRDAKWFERFKPTYYCQFYLDVESAQAKARQLAEGIVKSKQPFQWLRYGPGQSRPGREGWTDFKETSDMLIQVNADGSVANSDPLVPMDEHGREIPNAGDVVEAFRILHEMGLAPPMDASDAMPPLEPIDPNSPDINEA